MQITNVNVNIIENTCVHCFLIESNNGKIKNVGVGKLKGKESGQGNSSAAPCICVGSATYTATGGDILLH